MPGAFTNPFQSAPHDLFKSDFVATRVKEITRLERQLDQDDGFKEHILGVFNAKRGVHSALVNWRLFQNIFITEFIDAIGVKDLRTLMKYFIRHLDSRRKGFPDLFLSYPNGTYEFVEVKGPGDQLSLSQRVWLEKLESMSIPSRVVKVALPQ